METRQQFDLIIERPQPKSLLKVLEEAKKQIYYLREIHYCTASINPLTLCFVNHFLKNTLNLHKPGILASCYTLPLLFLLQVWLHSLPTFVSHGGSELPSNVRKALWVTQSTTILSLRWWGGAAVGWEGGLCGTGKLIGWSGVVLSPVLARV